MRKSLIVFLVLASLVAIPAAYRAYMVRELKQPILASLKDPDSAQFRNVRYVGNWTVGGAMLCGEVNSKNALGGYVGYTKFSYAPLFVIPTIGNAQISPLDGQKAPSCEDYARVRSKWWWLTI